MQNSRAHGRHAFSLIELLVTIAIIALLVSVLLPALGSARRSARQALCTANMQQLSRANAAYANDHKTYLGSFHGELNDTADHGMQAVRLEEGIARAIRDQTDQVLPDWNFQNNATFRSVLEAHEHLAMREYMSGKVVEKSAVCPEDQARLGWQKNPTSPLSWGAVPKWNPEWMAYSSTYQLVPAAAMYLIERRRFTPAYVMYSQGVNHDVYTTSGKIHIGHRKIGEVAFPSMKVHMMDSQQRHEKQQMFYSFQDARQPLVFFDGSVSTRKTKDATMGWDPDVTKAVNQMVPTTFAYRPDPAFESPIPSGQPLAAASKMVGYYRWTYSGLHGVDFGTKELKSLVGEIYQPY